jgi:hypothetical protein
MSGLAPVGARRTLRRREGILERGRGGMLLTCPNGHENPDGQHFCGECGAATTPVERTGPSAEGEPTERAAIHWEAPEPAAGPPEQVPGPPPEPPPRPPPRPAPGPARRPPRPWYRKKSALVIAGVLVVLLIAGAAIARTTGGSGDSSAPDGEARSAAPPTTAPATSFPTTTTAPAIQTSLPPERIVAGCAAAHAAYATAQQRPLTRGDNVPVLLGFIPNPGDFQLSGGLAGVLGSLSDANQPRWVPTLQTLDAWCTSQGV